MKRSKKLCILLGILLLVCAAAFLVSRHEEEKERIKNSDEVILTIDKELVTALSWENETEALAFHKGESWSYDEDEEFPVSEEKIDELLEVFTEFGVSFIIEEVENFAQYGLDDPVCTISLETEEKTYEVLLGDYSTMDSERYVSIGDGNVYLVKEDPLDQYQAVLDDMIDHDDLPDFETIDQIQIAGVQDYQIRYEEESDHSYSEDDVYFTDIDGQTRPLDSALVEDYLWSVSGMDLTDYVTYKVTDEELADYGLDDPELSVTIDYAYADEETEEEVKDTFVLHISRDPDERSEAETASEDEEDDEEEITAYARVAESRIIYSIPSGTYKELMAVTYDDLRHAEVFWGDTALITQIDITLEGVAYTITSKGDEDERIYHFGEEELELASFRSALSGLEAAEFTDEKPTEKEELRMTLHLDHEHFPQVEIILYRYDGSDCLAVVDGEVVSLVPRLQAVDLIESVNAIVLKN